MATNKKLRLVPVTGKYCQVSAAGKKFEVWRVLPGAPKDVKGTAFDYNTAVMLLSLQPPVVSLVPKIEDGKYVKQLEDKDLAAIHEAQMSGQAMISNAFNHLSDPAANDSSDKAVIAAQKEQIDALKQTIEAQKEQNAAELKAMQEQMKSITAQMANLQKTSDKDDKTK